MNISGIDFTVKNETSGFFSLAERRNGDGFLLYDLSLQFDQPTSPDSVSFSFELPYSIDHIVGLGENFSVKQYRVIEDQAALDASDHSPVLADVAL